MSARQSPRTKKRLRQSTLSGNSALSSGSDSKRRRGSFELSGAWDEGGKGIMIYEPNTWKANNYELLRKSPLKIAAYDLDSTIITTRSRAKFPKSATDWRLLNSHVAPKFAELAEQGYVFVIFTNQAGVSSGRISEDFVRTRIDGVLAALKVDVGVFVATTKDQYRKPGPGMWDLFVQRTGGVAHVDSEASFYVGDGAGRPARGGTPKDFSDSDLRFSINIGLRFMTPEQHFLKENEDNTYGNSVAGFDPRAIVPSSASVYINESTDMNAVLREIVSPQEMVDDIYAGALNGQERPPVQTMIIMHGLPASGKTTFVHRHLVPYGYVWINHDTLRTFSRSARTARESLALGKSIVVDNTNPDRVARGKYIEIARAHNAGMKILCLSMQTDEKIVRHLSVVREWQSQGAIHVPAVAFNCFSKRAERPDTIEGIDRIGEVRFVPRFGNEQECYLFTRLT